MNASDDRPATMTVEEAGQLLGLSRSSAYRAAARGELPTLQFGRRLIVPTARLLAMLGLDGLPLAGDRASSTARPGSSPTTAGSAQPRPPARTSR